MKKLIALLTVLLPLAAGAQNSTVKCTFNGLPDNKIVVGEARGGRVVPVDTVTLDAKGRMKVERAVADPTMVFLTLPQANSPMVHVLLLPRENITLEVDYMPAINLLNVTSAKGSDNMVLYKEYTNLISNLVLDQHTDRVAEEMEKLLMAHPDVLMSAFLATFFDQQFEQYVTLFKTIRDSLITKWPDHELVKHIDGRLRSVLLPGMEAPDIVMNDPNGKERKLSDLRGKVVLIDFWASWCRPCRMENPNVVRLYGKYHDKGFEIFSVSLDKDYNSWVKAIETDNLSWPNHVSDLKYWSSAAGRLYGISSIPSTVLVDREGKVVARNLRGRELENKLEEIFNQ